MDSVPALLRTRIGEIALQPRLADSFATRLRGLMLSAPLALDQGLLITRCASVHSAWMRYPIDLVWLDLDGHVLGCSPGLQPWRVSWGPRGTAHALELPAGSIQRLGIEVADRLEHPRLRARSRQ